MNQVNRPALQMTSQGTLLPIKAMPGSRSNTIRGWENGRLKIAVTQVAEKGKANQAIQSLLAKSLGISKRDIQLVSGETSREKVFLLVGVKPGSIELSD